jgi:hypothetical protein
MLMATLCGLLLCCGCANDTAVAHGYNTALNSDDLVAMTDDMSRKIMASPVVQAALAQEGKLRVVVEPVENNMTAEVLPSGPAQAFTGRLRVLLAEHNPNDFTWVMNRDAWHFLRSKELAIDPGPPPDAIQPRYALTARFSSLTKEDAQRRSSYYLCQYDLTDINHRYILWSDKYEVKKKAVKEFLD